MNKGMILCIVVQPSNAQPVNQTGTIPPSATTGGTTQGKCLVVSPPMFSCTGTIYARINA